MQKYLKLLAKRDLKKMDQEALVDIEKQNMMMRMDKGKSRSNNDDVKMEGASAYVVVGSGGTD